MADDFENNIRFVNRGAKNYNMPVNEMEMPVSNLQNIECEINKEYSVQCRKDGNEVYLPFSFIEKYFEVGNNFLCRRYVNVFFFVKTLGTQRETFLACPVVVYRCPGDIKNL